MSGLFSISPEMPDADDRLPGNDLDANHALRAAWRYLYQPQSDHCRAEDKMLVSHRTTLISI